MCSVCVCERERESVTRSCPALVFSNDPLSPRDDLIKANFTLQVIFQPIIEFVLCIKPLKSLEIMLTTGRFRPEMIKEEVFIRRRDIKRLFRLPI